jgi:hypothetical protein
MAYWRRWKLTESECGVILLYNEKSSQQGLFAHYSQGEACKFKDANEKNFSLEQRWFLERIHSSTKSAGVGGNRSGFTGFLGFTL